jgi:small subunit ribosomal protein S20
MAKKGSSAEKRRRQSEVRRLANKSAKTALRSQARKFVEASDKKDETVSAVSLKMLIKKLDNAARKGIIKKNAASRKKSRMQKRYNAVFGIKTGNSETSA